MYKNKLRLLLSIMVLAFIFSCKPKTIYEKRDILQNKTWEHSKSFVYEFTISDNQQNYDFLIPIKHTKDIEFNDLKVVFKLNSDNGEERFLYKNIEVKNEKNAFVGNKLGDAYEVVFPYLKSINFKKTGKYTLTIINSMSLVLTEGISGIGLIIKESK